MNWKNIKDEKPIPFVSVLGVMDDADIFPPVRECYMVGDRFFFPALDDVHPVTYWADMPNETKETIEKAKKDTENEISMLRLEIKRLKNELRVIDENKEIDDIVWGRNKNKEGEE